MGDYGADANPNTGEAQNLCRYYGLIKDIPVKFDQWTMDDDIRVQSFHDGTGRVKLFVKYNQQELAPPD